MIDRSMVILLMVAMLALAFGLPELLAQADEEKEKPNEGWWQLEDDSIFTATVAPWPLKQGGAVKIHAEATTDDNDEKFKGTVHYRIATAEENKAPWIAMQRGKAADKDDVAFDATATLPQAGKVWIQFKVNQTSEDEAIELTDWDVALEK